MECQQAIRLGHAASLWRVGRREVIGEDQPFYTPSATSGGWLRQLILLDGLCLAVCRTDDARGGLFTWKNSDELSLFVGGVNGQDETDGLTDSLAVLTGFAWTPKDKKYALNFAIMTGGLEPTNDRQFSRREPTSARTSPII